MCPSRGWMPHRLPHSWTAVRNPAAASPGSCPSYVHAGHHIVYESGLTLVHPEHPGAPTGEYPAPGAPARSPCPARPHDHPSSRARPGLRTRNPAGHRHHHPGRCSHREWCCAEENGGSPAGRRSRQRPPALNSRRSAGPTRIASKRVTATGHRRSVAARARGRAALRHRPPRLADGRRSP
jgi:hypothetical protein